MQGPMMRRRDFIAGVGATSIAGLVCSTVHAQQAARSVVGFLNAASAVPFAPMVAAFRRGLNSLGYVEGENLAIEFRWGDSRPERLSDLAADLVAKRVSVIAASGGLGAVIAAKMATADIPIVFTSGSNPVTYGIVASFNRPGGNATGVNMLITEIEGKRLGLLHELVPAATRIAAMVDPRNVESDTDLSDAKSAARSMGVRLDVLPASSEGEIETAFATLVQAGAQALLITGSPFFVAQRERLVALAARHRVPTLYEARIYAAAGGLISYGPNIPDVYRQVGVYVGRILKGAKPADLPVVQPTVIELAINLKTARALGLEIPNTLLATADEVIE
jgi:putative tryptophan/tyrosine transport system substrate-binding protein